MDEGSHEGSSSPAAGAHAAAADTRARAKHTRRSGGGARIRLCRFARAEIGWKKEKKRKEKRREISEHLTRVGVGLQAHGPRPTGQAANG